MNHPHFVRDRTGTILVVDDNLDCRAGLELLLGRVGYRVIQAESAEQAFACLQGGAMPDLILLDMLLPGMDGLEFLERLDRAHVAGPVPIVIMTGMALGREWAAEHGCAGFIQKPIDRFVLMEVVSNCLNRHKQLEHAV
jgi:two-component system phosphate regulon response regulator PhoB